MEPDHYRLRTREGHEKRLESLITGLFPNDPGAPHPLAPALASCLPVPGTPAAAVRAHSPGRPLVDARHKPRNRPPPSGGIMVAVNADYHRQPQL